MGQCGCGDFNADFKFKGPGNITYVLQIYDSCEYCETPAGVIIYAMNPKDCKMWDVEHLQEVKIEDVGTAFAVIDPFELGKKLSKWLEIEGAEGDFYSNFREVVWDSIQANRKRLKAT